MSELDAFWDANRKKIEVIQTKITSRLNNVAGIPDDIGYPKTLDDVDSIAAYGKELLTLAVELTEAASALVVGATVKRIYSINFEKNEEEDK